MDAAGDRTAKPAKIAKVNRREGPILLFVSGAQTPPLAECVSRPRGVDEAICRIRTTLA